MRGTALIPVPPTRNQQFRQFVSPMTNVTVQLSEREIEALKARTGKRSAAAALKAWATRGNAKRSTAKLRAAIRNSLKEEAAGKGLRFDNSR